MPRPLRIEYDGAWYHVMNRGANHNNIFNTTEHYLIFLSLLENITTRFKIEIHAYCLMGNHYHLVIHTPHANLGKAMRYLDGVYTQRFNRLENRDGPLFRGRYKAILIERDEYLLQVSRYIHLNPVEAQLCEHAAQYRWSSYLAYINGNDQIHWLFTNSISTLLNSPDWKNIYRNFVDEGVDKELNDFYIKDHTPTILGDISFRKKHLEGVAQTHVSEYATDINRTKPYIDICVIKETVINYYKIREEILLLANSGKTNRPRMIAIYLSHLFTNLTHAKIGKYYNLKRGSISSTIARIEKLISNDKKLAKDIQEVVKILNNIEESST